MSVPDIDSTPNSDPTDDAIDDTHDDLNHEDTGTSEPGAIVAPTTDEDDHKSMVSPSWVLLWMPIPMVNLQ